MNIVGSPYSLLLNNSSVRITNRNNLANCVLIQAHGGDVSYRLDGGIETINGFILPQKAPPLLIELSKSNNALTVWSTEKYLSVRLVVQECN